jgi:hypothetical protein
MNLEPIKNKNALCILVARMYRFPLGTSSLDFENEISTALEQGNRICLLEKIVVTEHLDSTRVSK